MADLCRRLDRLEASMVRQHVERQMVKVARMCEAEGIPDSELPSIRQGLEAYARWTVAHAPLTLELVEAEIQRAAEKVAAETGLDAAEIIAEAERLVEVYDLGA